MQDLVFELAGRDILKVKKIKLMKISEALIWMIVKEKKAYTEWLMHRNMNE